MALVIPIAWCLTSFGVFVLYDQHQIIDGHLQLPYCNGLSRKMTLCKFLSNPRNNGLQFIHVHARLVRLPLRVARLAHVHFVRDAWHARAFYHVRRATNTAHTRHTQKKYDCHSTARAYLSGIGICTVYHRHKTKL